MSGQNRDTAQQHIDDVFRLINSGQLLQAEQKCSSMLIQQPQDVNLIALHGAILLKLGRRDEAKNKLQKAIALEPEFAKPYEDLGRLFLLTKKPEEAARRFSQAIGLDDSQASAYGGLANALSQLGRMEEASTAHQQFLNLSSFAGILLESDKLLQQGEKESAGQLCKDLLLREPNNTQVLRMLARIASIRNKYIEAEGYLRQIIKLSPQDYLPYNELGRFLVEQSRFPEAIDMFEHAMSLDNSIVDNYRLLGDAQAVIGKSMEALTSYQRALKLHAEDPHALAGQGHMQRIAGNKTDAIVSYEKCTMVQPAFGDTWWNLASLRGYQLSDDQLKTIHKQIESNDLAPDPKIAMHFALARTHESHGDFDAAWQEYELGNNQKRQLIEYDPVQTETMHAAIMEQFTTKPPAHAARKPTSAHTPIFIVGMPRSGSTLIEQILASHSLVEGAGELPYVFMLSSTLGMQRADALRYPEIMSGLSDEQLESLGNAYIYHTGIHRSQGLPFFTDKMPSNFSHVGLIHKMLPNAKVIDVRRHPMATCIANYRQLYAQGKNQTYDLIEMAEYYLEYCKIMDHWQKFLPGFALRVQYEDVVADLQGQTRRILDFCRLPWEDTCLDFHKNTRPVNTASAEQVREPIYTDAVDFWKNYESQLEPVRDLLDPLIQSSGFEEV
jgi:Flp pilus assembly protein TadD